MLKKIGFLTLGQGFNILINMLFLPYMSRALSYENYGTYGQTILIVMSITAFLSFGLPQIINVQFSTDKADFKKVLSNNVFLGMLLGLIGAIISLSFLSEILLLFKNPEIKNPFFIFIWSIIFSIPFNSFNTYLIYQGRIKQSLIVSIFPNIIKVIGVICAVHFYKTVESVTYVLLVVSIIQFVWCLILAFEHITYKVKRVVMKEQFIQGFPLGITSIVAIVMLYLDSLMVSNMLGVKEYAIFRNGAFEFPFLGTLYASIAAVILPEVSKLWQRNKKLEIAQLKGKVILYTTLLVYPILGILIFNSQQLIQWYFGSAYAASAIIFSVYNFTLIIRVNNYSDVLVAANKTSKILVANVIALMVNAVLNYYFIVKWQAVGAAMSTVLSLFFLAGILLFYNHRLLDNMIGIYLNIKKTLSVLIISLLSGFVFCYLVPNYIFKFEHFYYQIIAIAISLVFQYLLFWKLKIIDAEMIHVFAQKFKNKIK